MCHSILVAIATLLLVSGAFQPTEGNKTEAAIEEPPIVLLSGGQVKGLVQEVENGTKLFVYRGIRFGQAKRFEQAKFADSWAEVYDATWNRNACPQPKMQNFDKLFQWDSQSEDCLYLNVWRPAEEKANRSVMFMIHGGAFAVGTIFAPLMDAKYIASRGDVIVVGINYRLGPFGFMHGGDVPGNLGLYDQILGLKWVKENIAQFGGDPNQVTIFGGSAGAMSVGSLVLSPLAKGLFKRALLQGGAPNSHLGASDKSKAVKLTEKFASKLNCSTEEIQQAMDCIRSKSTYEIISKLGFDFTKDEFFTPIYGDELMPVSPVEALKTGAFNRDIDIMMGVTKDEGSFFAAQIFPKLLSEPANLTIESTKEDIRYMMGVLYNQSYADEVTKFYTDKLTNPTDEELKIVLSNVWGDYHLICPTVLFGEQIAKQQPQNRYYFYRLMQSSSSAMPFHQKWMGVTHGEDGVVILKPDLLKNSEDQELSRDLTLAITQFAKTGVAGKLGESLEWEEAYSRADTEPVTRYSSLQTSDMKMVSGQYKKTCDEFWKSRINQ